MSIRDDIEKVNEKIEETSFAMEMLQFSKEQNKQQHKHNVFLGLIIVLLILCLVGSNAYWIYEYTHTAIEETTEISEVDNENGNTNACVGDNCNNGEINYGEGESIQEN